MIRHHALALAAVVAGMAGTLGLTTAGARALDVQSFSSLLLLLNALVIGPVVLQAGCGTYVMRQVSRARAVSGSDVAHAELLGVLVRVGQLAAGLLGLVGVGHLVLYGEVDLAFLMVLASVWLETVRLTASEGQRAEGRLVWGLAISPQSRAAVSGLALAAMVHGRWVESFVGVATVVLVFQVAALGLALLALRPLSPVRHIETRRLLVTSAPDYVNTASNFLAARIDLWVAAAFLGATDVARYGAAATIALQLTQPAAILMVTAQPRVAALWARADRSGAERLMVGCSVSATVLGVLICVALALVGEPVLGYLFGAEFRAAWSLLLVLSLGSVASSFGVFSQAAMQMSGHSREAAWANLAALPIGLAACVAGATSGALGLAVGSSVLTACSRAAVSRQARVRLGIATTPMGFGLYLRKDVPAHAGRH